MNALVFKDISDASCAFPIEAGKAIYKNFPDMSFDRKIILVNGQTKTPDYIVQEGDIVVIRSIPGVLSATAMAVVTWVTVGALVIGGVVAGVMIYNAQEDAKKAQEEIDKMKEQMKDSVVNLPYLKGASNTVATGKTQPYIVGEHLFTPYIMNSGGQYKGFSSIAGTDGNEQFYTVVLEGGFNKQVIRKLYCDDVILKDWGSAETVPQEGLYSFDEDSVFFNEDSVIEIAQDGQPFTTAAFTKKIVEQQVHAQIKKSDDDSYEDLIYTLEQYAMSADVCILFNGLLCYDSAGTKIDRSVTVIPYYSVDNGTNWVSFTFDQNGIANNTFTRNTLNQLRFTAHVDFPYSDVKNIENPVLLKLVCTSPKYDGTSYDDVYVQWVQSTVYNPDLSKVANAFVPEKIIEAKEAALSTLIGLHIKSTLSNEDKLNKINCITSGVARVWTGTTWTVGRVPTRNPASWLLEVLTSSTHIPSQCDDSEIDLDAFGELYEYCESENITVDMVITSGDTKANLINTIQTVCNAVLYQDIYGQISVAVDTFKENAIAVLNTQNLISFEYEKDIARRTDGIKITYTSRKAGYAQDTYLVLRDGVTDGSTDNIYREMTLQGITEHEQVVKYGRRLMAIDELRPKTVTAQVGKEGLYFTPLSKVLVQHPSLKIGLGTAEIKDVYLTEDGTAVVGVSLYEPVEYDSEDVRGFGCIIQCVGESYCTPISRKYTAVGSGRVYDIYFQYSLPISAGVFPHPGDVLSYGYLNAGSFDTITSPFLITGIDPTETGYTLKMVDYNPAVYVSGAIPLYTPNITQPREAAKMTIPARDGLPGKSAYKIDIVSSNGLIFRQESRDTVLKARVWLGDVEVTESLLTSQFRWIRTSTDTAADAVWNQNHYVGYKEVTITPADFFARADFKCEIVEA